MGGMPVAVELGKEAARYDDGGGGDGGDNDDDGVYWLHYFLCHQHPLENGEVECMLALQQGHLQLAKSLVGLLLVLLWHDQVFDPHLWELVVQNGVGDVVKEL